MTRLYADDVELYDIAFTWDLTAVAAYDGNDRDRPEVELEHGGGLLWHELVAP